jgi:hypothetical protein
MSLELLMVGLLAAQMAGTPAEPSNTREVEPQQAPGGPVSPTTDRAPTTAFVRFGWAGFSDDEGSLGTGATVGAGVVIPLGRRFAVQLAYDRQHHRRDFDDAAPPGISPSSGGFTGTEQLVTAKVLMFFRRDQAVRPYAGIGAGLLDSERTSEFPSYVFQPGGAIVAGPPEVYRYHTSEFALSFSGGFDARVTKRFSILSDLTVDGSHPSALSSARLSAGAGWRF